ncbi:hypothetical protein TCAL_16591 [Tigriopus californicus]|uniref:Uncharacterized protein n=1 Tax=Tigriopus californicus TaxID=6832 RepID=A0A553NBA1_TIGCA|nr:uncharacterized protein LOC131888233 [Tigriopus californicus]TRY62726.1 hypothetical protein TCAL_16591 [Tigriopus californicus]
MSDNADREFEAAMDFQPDPWALQSILTSAGLASGTLQPQFKAGPVSHSGLTPAGKLPKHYKIVQQRFDCFQAPQGHVFFRPKTPNSRTKPPGLQGASAGSRQRAWDRGVALSGRPKRVEPTPAPLAPQTENKSRPGWPLNRVPVYLSSISERKTLLPPGIEINGVKRESLARKALDFGGPVQAGPAEKENNDPSSADRIRLRESILALPRPSLSGWLRASLTPAELDRMFEDDSTESFEAWEKRLKTPKKALVPSTMANKAKTNPTQAHLANTSPAQSSEVDLVRSPDPTGFLARLAAEMDPTACPTFPLTPVSASESKLSSPRPSPLSKLDPPSVDEDSTCALEVEVTLENQVSAESNLASPGPPSPVFEIVYEGPELPPTLESKLERSKSLGDVSVVLARDGDAISDGAEHRSPMKTALSESDLTEARSTQDLLLEALQAHQDFMAEQDLIQNQINALMSQAQTRRSEFRGLWGVSPRSISQLRSVKTVLGHHKVQFSRTTDPISPDATSSSTAKATEESDLVFSPQLEPLERVFGDLERDLDQDEDQTMSFEDMDITPCRGLMVRNKKSVHFAATTPIRHVITPSPSPKQVKVSVPLMMGRRTMDHEGHKSTSFLFTPMPKYGKTMSRSVMEGAGDEDEDSLKIHMNTPMALESLSQKVQAELALLYEDETKKDFVDARENLDFDE